MLSGEARGEARKNKRLYLCPFVCLGVISLHYVQVGLSIITPDGIQLVTKQTDAHCVSANAHGCHCSPHVCFGIISERKVHESSWHCFWNILCTNICPVSLASVWSLIEICWTHFREIDQYFPKKHITYDVVDSFSCRFIAYLRTQYV